MNRWLMLSLLVLGLAAPKSALATWTFQRHDCASVPDWVATNSQTLVNVAKIVVPLVGNDTITVLGQQFGLQPSLLPSVDGKASAGWLGVTAGAVGGYVSLGASPLGILNSVLHLACVELSNGE